MLEVEEESRRVKQESQEVEEESRRVKQESQEVERNQEVKEESLVENKR